MMSESNAERLRKSLSHYKGFVFRWQQWKALSPTWDHDHCAGCWARFAERPEEWNDRIYTEGWVTLWPTTRTAEEDEKTVAELRAAGKSWFPLRSLVDFSWIGCAQTALLPAGKNCGL